MSMNKGILVGSEEKMLRLLRTVIRQAIQLHHICSNIHTFKLVLICSSVHSLGDVIH